VRLDNWGNYLSGPVVKTGRIVELMRRYPNLLGDLSAGSALTAMTRDPSFSYEFLDEFQDRLFYGTDICQPKNRTNPIFFGMRDFLGNALNEGHLSRTAYEKITHGNAERLLDLPPEG
jgi:predicted TIM-barrel fold metal-dependent hydrolase